MSSRSSWKLCFSWRLLVESGYRGDDSYYFCILRGTVSVCDLFRCRCQIIVILILKIVLISFSRSRGTQPPSSSWDLHPIPCICQNSALQSHLSSHTQPPRVSVTSKTTIKSKLPNVWYYQVLRLWDYYWRIKKKKEIYVYILGFSLHNVMLCWWLRPTGCYLTSCYN